MLLVAGTHGNELNAPWLFDMWSSREDLIKTSGIPVSKVIGNPAARKLCKRYINRDLNRSFTSNSLISDNFEEIESIRAQELLKVYGPSGKDPCQIAFDFHSTTSSMGSCLVVYGRRTKDLALASLIQHRIGLPIYLHESDKDQHGFLVECWPCGLVVEIGPVAQGLINAEMVSKTKLTLEVCLEEIAKVKAGEAKYPDNLIIHRHLGSIDFPRDDIGNPDYFIHKNVQDKDWQILENGDSLFQNLEGKIIRNSTKSNVVPVFINEAAYIEKNIAMSLTKREVWQFNSIWKTDLQSLF